MTRKALPASIALLFVLSVPLVGAEDDEQILIAGVHGYHQGSDYYCLQVTPGIGSSQPPLCTGSPLLSSLGPEVNQSAYLPDLTPPDEVRDAVGGITGPAWEEVEHLLRNRPDQRELLRDTDLESPVYDTGLAPEDAPLVDAPCEVNQWDRLVVESGRRVLCQDREIHAIDVIVAPTARLELHNTTLIMDAPEPAAGEYKRWPKIHVQSEHSQYEVRHAYHGGTLVVQDSRIVADPDDDASWRIEPNTVIRIQDSMVKDFRWIGVLGWQDVGAREFTFTDSTMTGGWGTDLGTTPARIENSFFDGVSIPLRTSGDAVFHNTAVTGCHVGVVTYGEADVVVTDNTITNCGVAVAQWDCHPIHVSGNDFHGNHGSFLGEFCGDARGNYWGIEPFADRFPYDDVDFSDWSPKPLHPERLPTPVAHVPAQAVVNHLVELDAVGSHPSKEFGFPIQAFAWHLPGGSHGEQRAQHAFVHPGNYTVTLTVADEKGFQNSWTGKINVLPASERLLPRPVSENQAPYFQILKIQVNRIDGWRVVEEPRRGEALYADVEVHDPDRDAVKLSYRWLRDKDPYGSWQDGAFHNHTERFVPEGVTQAGEVWELIVTVTDGEHWSEGSVRVQILAVGEDSAQGKAAAPVQSAPASEVDLESAKPSNHKVPAPGVAILAGFLAALVVAKRRTKP